MFFLGYHGTSELHASSIIRDGVLPEKLSRTGQIGQGFYIAKLNKHLPRWAATIATSEGRAARASEWYSKAFFERVMLYLTGNACLPVPPNARATILKVYSTRPLNAPRWSVMQIGDMQMIRAIGGLSVEMKEINLPEYLQMVIPVDLVRFLVCKRDDGIAERSETWLPRESPVYGNAAAAPSLLRRTPTIG